MSVVKVKVVKDNFPSLFVYEPQYRRSPLFGVFPQQAGQQRFGFGREAPGEADLLHHDELEEPLVVLVVEGQPSAHHLVHHHSQTPPVHRAAVIVVLQHLTHSHLLYKTSGIRAVRRKEEINTRRASDANFQTN